jgi:hypothetical protein
MRLSFSIYIGMVAIYYALKLPLGLSRATNAPATAIAACASVFTVQHLDRVRSDWNSVMTKSVLGILILLLLIGAVYYAVPV